jgi:two-component system nitrate/nitrite sensor histidine kinase NarX
MDILRQMKSPKILTAGLAGCFLSWIALWIGWTLQNPQRLPSLLFLIISILESIGVGILIMISFALFQRQSLMSENLAKTENKFNLMTLELNSISQINHILATAQDEKQLIEGVLNLMQEASDAAGVSFVPMDEWGIPLPAFSLGRQPQPVLTAWAEHLSTSRVRQTCNQCQNLHAEAGTKCAVLDGPFNLLDVYCLPVRRDELMLGMINLYLAPTQKLDPATMSFLETLLDEVAQAVEVFRHRAHEGNILRYYQQEKSVIPELDGQLAGLMDDIAPLLEAEATILQIQPPDGRKEPLQLLQGSATGLAILKKSSGLLDEASGKEFPVEMKGQNRIQVEPINLHGTVIGGLWILQRDGVEFGENHRSVVAHITHQVGLLVDMERLRKSLKSDVVIQERTRLAREIHDSLAQTLAFLKLTAAQMQHYLGQGDYQNLNLALKQSYQALSEAYIDTRKVIEDLRLSPQEDLSGWLTQLAQKLEDDHGIAIECNFSDQIPTLSPEIQVQLLRIIQEALNNIRKHSHATHVALNVRQWNGNLVLEVQDDGQGFLPEEVPEVSRYGLRGMRERSEAIGADFQVISQPGQGTTIRLLLPVPQQEVGD